MSESNDNKNIEESINLYEQIQTLKREYKVLITAVFIFTFIGFTKATATKPIWKGEFNIVLSDDGNGPGVGANPLNILKNSGNSDDLLTEVEILKSPVVLMPVFDLYKNISNKNENFRYRNWAGNISVEFRDGTKVLNVYYQDEKKDLIMPVLKKISKEYQNYSKRDHNTKFENQLIYLNGQIEKYAKKSKLSLANAQTYAINNNLTPLTGEAAMDKEIRSPNMGVPTIAGIVLNNDTSSNAGNMSPFNIEFERTRAANEIAVIEKKLVQLDQLSDKNAIFLLGKSDGFAGKTELVRTIEDLDLNIQLLKSNFTEKEEKLIKAKKLKETYLNIFKKEIYGILNARLMDAKARMDASERPEGVLVKYRELLREASRDEQFITKLELDKQLVLMKRAMIVNPWELISEPYVLDRPVNRSKKIILMIWIAMGFSVGSAISIIKEKLSGLIFSKEKLLRLIPYKLLAILELGNNNNWDKEIITPLNLSNIDLSKNEVINLLILGNISEKNIFTIESIFKKYSKINLVRNPNLIRNPKDINILIVENRNILKREINAFLEKINTYNLKINHWILID